ncbi:GPI-anchored protein of unknown function, partial [Reticulomyxa filosa]
RRPPQKKKKMDDKKGKIKTATSLHKLKQSTLFTTYNTLGQASAWPSKSTDPQLQSQNESNGKIEKEKENRSSGNVVVGKEERRVESKSGVVRKSDLLLRLCDMEPNKLDYADSKSKKTPQAKTLATSAKNSIEKKPRNISKRLSLTNIQSHTPTPSVHLNINIIGRKRKIDELHDCDDEHKASLTTADLNGVKGPTSSGMNGAEKTPFCLIPTQKRKRLNDAGSNMSSTDSDASCPAGTNPNNANTETSTSTKYTSITRQTRPSSTATVLQTTLTNHIPNANDTNKIGKVNWWDRVGKTEEKKSDQLSASSVVGNNGNVSNPLPSACQSNAATSNVVAVANAHAKGVKQVQYAMLLTAINATNAITTTTTTTIATKLMATPGGKKKKEKKKK